MKKLLYTSVFAALPFWSMAQNKLKTEIKEGE
jgi:hypothetical protein